MHGVRGDVMKESGQCKGGNGELEIYDQRSRIGCGTDDNWRRLGSTNAFIVNKLLPGT